MLAPDYLDHAPDRLVLLWQQVEDDILRDVARRISKIDTMTPTANWQLWRYEQTEALRQDVVKKLARYTGKSEAEIRRLMQEAATRAMEAEDEIYYHYGKEPTPFADNATLQALLNAGYQQTAGTFHNLTATTVNTVSGQFEAALDRAHLKVSSGAFDYKSAVKSAVDSLADTMKYVTYPTGHTDTLEVAARRAVLTGVNQTGAKLQVARADEMGVEFFETTAHGGARPSHAEWQGRQFHRGGAVDYMGKHYPDFEAATGYGTGAGLCGWNCRHTFFAIFPELGAPPAWTQESLEALNARDIEYNGCRYTRYEISQMQRARERTVRKYKRRYLAEDAAGADTTALNDVAASTKTATAAANTATQQATAAAGSASTAATKAGEASTSAGEASASAGEAEKAQKAAEDAAKLAGTRAGTDKALNTENAPADAAAVGKAFASIIKAYDIALAAASWKATSDTAAKNAGWAYQCDATISGCTAVLEPSATVSLESVVVAQKAGLGSICSTDAGFCRFYAEKVPTADISLRLLLTNKNPV